MADINIERKSRNIWPWLIGLIALLLIGAVILYFATAENGTRDLDPTMENGQEQVEPLQPGQDRPGEPAAPPQ
ncbi:MAG: hypothetical protein ACOCTG_03195 [Bacteroidota bacterium]